MGTVEHAGLVLEEVCINVADIWTRENTQICVFFADVQRGASCACQIEVARLRAPDFLYTLQR